MISFNNYFKQALLICSFALVSLTMLSVVPGTNPGEGKGLALLQEFSFVPNAHAAAVAHSVDGHPVVVD